jgi:adenosylcobinamide-GDP ribazoletransferase
MHSLLVALAFLTIFPIRFHTLPPAEGVARSRFWYPAVGLLLGALLGGWTSLTVRFASPLLCAFLVLLVWVVLTGALHLDGLCDLCDGLLSGRTAEDRLRIMKDPHLGTFGLAGGVLLLLGKWVVLQDVIARTPERAPWLVAGAVSVARCLALCMAAGSRYPRAEGTGKALIEASAWWEVFVFAGIAAGLTFLAAPGADPWMAALLLLPALLVVMGLRWLCRRRLGGVTGDCLGAAIELAEWTFLLAAALQLPLAA